MAKITEVVEEDAMLDTDSGDIEEILTSVVQRASFRDFIYLQRLGRGSFGEVYLARHILTEKLHALKILSKDKVIAQNLIRYCTTEKRILANIRHPFIVHLEYVFQTPQKLVLVMKFCRAGDLSSQLMHLRK
jgi:serine/threonine protein kinase